MTTTKNQNFLLTQPIKSNFPPHAITSTEAFDATMRVRTSLGIRPTGFYGNYHMDNTIDVHLANINKDTSITFELKHDDKIDSNVIHLQVATLFTAPSGQRRIRIHNLATNVAHKYADVFSHANNNVLMSYLLKMAILEGKVKATMDIKDTLVDSSVNVLAMYRKHCSSGSPPGQLILPETIKLLPLMLHSLVRHDVLSTESSIPCDQRAYLRAIIANKPLLATQILLYPMIHELSSFVPLEGRLGTQVRCRYDRLKSDSCYLITNGLNLFFWIGQNVSDEFIQGVFQLENARMVSSENCNIHYEDGENEHVIQVRDSIELVRKKYSFGHFMRLCGFGGEKNLSKKILGIGTFFRDILPTPPSQ